MPFKFELGQVVTHRAMAKHPECADRMFVVGRYLLEYEGASRLTYFCRQLTPEPNPFRLLPQNCTEKLREFHEMELVEMPEVKHKPPEDPWKSAYESVERALDSIEEKDKKGEDT